jgi:hypothetical protein
MLPSIGHSSVMRSSVRSSAAVILASALLLISGVCGGTYADTPENILPTGVKAVWDLDKAYRETTPTRERICINGLWRWQPAEKKAEDVPMGNWGYFKVPGSWPGITDYMQEDTQVVFPHPSWKARNIAGVTAAWYQREITIPREWAGRRVTLDVPYLNSYAAVYVDAKKLGELHFPGGELDISNACRPGSQRTISLLVVAMPLSAVQMSFSDTNAAKEAQGSVQRRGLCGDVFVASEPKSARVGDVRVDTSVRKGEITFNTDLKNLAAGTAYSLRAKISDTGGAVAEFVSTPIRAADLNDGHFAFRQKWKPERLWDIITPDNQFDVTLSLRVRGGELLDTAFPERFGFREFWIDGRDFYLNGSRIYLSAVPFDNAQVSAAAATYQGAKETLLRMKSFGINFVYTHNYGCEPGTHLGFTEILRAADDVGMLVALSQPHFGQYKWQAADADAKNGYTRDAAFYSRVANSHPSVVMYSTSHNATGYVEGNNPDMIDGVQDPRPPWAKNGVQTAFRAEAIIKRLDPSRILYHHSSGNLGSVYSLNFYTNFTPIQEMDDWFGYWATKGVKPLFTCEFAVPCTWDWTMYRGWYRGAREFGSATVPWEYCMAEWNAQFYGDRAFQISEPEKTNLRWEAGKFRAGGGWHRWDFPHQVGATALDEQFPVIASYITSNWRAFRTWGLSASNPWQYTDFWKLRPGTRQARKDFNVDWENLQRPGFSPDYSERPFQTSVTAYERSDWEPNAAGRALLRNNMPLLAYIAGKPAAFTSKDHNFFTGETVEKQLIVINNSRKPISADCEWSVKVASPIKGNAKITVSTGNQERIPLRFKAPASLAPGKYELSASVHFDNGETQTDAFTLNVMPRPVDPKAMSKIAIFDPKGETAQLLGAMGISCQPVEAGSDLRRYEILVVGKGALSIDAPGPDVGRVRAGLKVIVFEQTGEVLEQRLGFRVAEYGLRQAFPRVPNHSLLKELNTETLRDWRGEATNLPPRLSYTIGEPYRHSTPVVKWCGLDVPRVWRCGSRGNVASALIEKPAKGDFLPIVDGGYSLQFSPLLEFREGKGIVLFCQLDVTGRTESDPAAETLVHNIIDYVTSWRPAPRRTVLYAGDPAGKRHLELSGISVGTYAGGKPATEQVVVVGSGGGKLLAQNKAALTEFLKEGGYVLALGLDSSEANSVLPSRVAMKKAEHIATLFNAPSSESVFAGVGPADVHNRAPREIPLVTADADVLGDGILAKTRDRNVVFFQLPPYEVSHGEGAVPTFVVNPEDAADGAQSALLTLGSASESGMRFGQKVKAGEVGKTYTVSVFVKPLGASVPLHLEIERASNPWDRAVKGDQILLPKNEWTELHETFTIQKAFPQGWFVYIAGGRDGARLRVDRFRITEGDYVPSKSNKREVAPDGAIAFTNASFEAGTQPWSLTCDEQYNLRRTYRRASFTLARLLGNMGVAASTPLPERFRDPVTAGKPEKRWLDAFYLDQPEEWDDPYRFFNW